LIVGYTLILLISICVVAEMARLAGRVMKSFDEAGIAFWVSKDTKSSVSAPNSVVVCPTEKILIGPDFSFVTKTWRRLSLM